MASYAVNDAAVALDLLRQRLPEVRLLNVLAS